MIITMTHQQMLQTWRRCAGLEPSVSSCSIERFDGVDVDSRLGAMMRQWYLDLLDSGDPSLVGQPVEAADLISVCNSGPQSASIACDQSVRRLCSLRLSDWERPATVADLGDVVRQVSLLANPFSRPGISSPLAWRDFCGSVFAAPATADSQVVEALAYLDPGPDSYRIDERALSTIPSSIQLF